MSPGAQGAAPTTGLELTVLGSSGSHTGPGRMCSGYLVRTAGATILLDAGNGSTANLQRLVPFDALDAVVISHRHMDHCADVIGMFYALRFDPSFGGRIPLLAPDGVVEALTAMLSRDSAMAFSDVFAPRTVTGGETCTVGDCALTFVDANHPPPTVSVRVERAGSIVAYSADTGGDDALVRTAQGADLFVCEATWQGDAADYPAGLHLTARGAGAAATAAGARRLVLTHVAGGLDPARSVREAAEAFDGPIEAAEDLASWRLP